MRVCFPVSLIGANTVPVTFIILLCNSQIGMFHVRVSFVQNKTFERHLGKYWVSIASKILHTAGTATVERDFEEEKGVECREW